MTRPTLRQLQFLVSVADEGTFRAAAEACGVTQPSLSSAIQELESVIGARLVERGARACRLTPAGREVCERARRAIAEVDEMRPAAKGADAPLSGPLRLGVIPTIAPFLTPKLAPLLRDRHPRLKLFIREDQTGRVLDGLKAGALDLGIIALPYAVAGVETAAAFDEPFELLAPAGHPLLAAARVAPGDLDPEELLLLEDGHCLREHALSACRAGAGSARREFAGTSLLTLAHMVAAGLGVTLAPALAVEAGLAAQTGAAARPFDPPLIGRQVGVAWRKGSVRARDGALLAETVAACAPVS